MTVMITTITGIGVAESISINNIDRNCMTAQESKLVSSFGLTPTEFPENYSQGCIMINEPGVMKMIISENPEMYTKWQNESLEESDTNIYLYQVDNSQFVSQERIDSLGTAEQRMRDTIAGMEKNNPSLKPVYLTIKGMPAYGIEPCSDCGTQTAKFGDGTVITQTYDVPSRLKIYSDDGKVYLFHGNVALDDLVKLGNSLQ